MTNLEWVNLQKDLVHYNGKLSGSLARSYIKLISNYPKAVPQARALFGDNGVYKATYNQIQGFINAFFLGGLSRNKKEEKFKR